ncbi:MAG TPA: hypothetical protein VFS08_16995, partial [Gemmatimonadaceae bacterium]|nr:hypothetical protein [Gemmatimonadaceae bacterium]
MSADLDRAGAPSAAPSPLSPALAALAAVAPGLRPLRWLGRSAAGGWVALGRAEGADAGLVLLELPAGWTGGGAPLPTPAVHRALVPGMPVAVGEGIAADDPATGGLSRAVLLAAVRDAAAELYEVLGDVPTEGRGLVYFALARDGGALHALQLQREAQPGGEVELVLAVFPVPETAGPEGGTGAEGHGRAGGEAVHAAGAGTGGPGAPGRGAPPDDNIAPGTPSDAIVPSPAASIPRPTHTIAAPARSARAAGGAGGAGAPPGRVT